MSNLFQMFGTNKNYEKNGVNIRYGFNDENKPIEFTIARAGGSNTAFLKGMEAALKPYRRQLQTDTMDEKLAGDLMRKVFCKTVILGWTGVKDENGKELTYSPETCEKLMERLPDLYADLREQAQNAALFRSESLEADAKNS